MKKTCRYCKKEFNSKYLKIHQKKCEKRKFLVNHNTQFTINSASFKIVDPKLKEVFGTHLEEFEKEIGKELAKQIQQNPQSFIKDLKRKGYFTENQS